MQGPQTTRTLTAWLAVFSLIVLGAKLWTIQIWATNIPYWDQWDEAQRLFKPWLDGTLTWHDFFLPHNEHRIVITRLLDLLEVKVNGQWDPVFQMVVNAVIHISYGCLLAAILWSAIGRKYGGLICCALVPFFALPFAAENTTHGFQSMMYFVNILSVTALLGLGFGRPGGGIWFCGLASAVLAIFTMASGFLITAAIIGLMILRPLKQRRITRGQMMTMAGCGMVIVLGLALRVEVPGHKILEAKSASGFISALMTTLGWPFTWPSLMAGVICLPLVVLLFKYFQPDFKKYRAAEFVLAFGLWVFLQAVMLAYGRALILSSSRYFDGLSMLPLASVAALFVLATDFDLAGWRRKIALTLTVAWSACILVGMIQCSQKQVDGYLQGSRGWGLLETENTRAFIATGDAGWLRSTMAESVPYWSPEILIALLREPKILSIQPALIRPPLKLEANQTLSTGFNTNDCSPGNSGQPFVKVWGNTSTNGALMAGHFVSRPMTTCLPELSVQLYRGTAETKIRLVGTGGRTVDLHPQFTDRWETLVVAAPPQPFVLTVENATANAPVAIGEIKELGIFSVWSQNLVNHGVLILSIGLLLGLLLAAVAVSRPGISFANEGLAWLFVLIVAITALLGAVCWRNFDGNEYAVMLHKKLAVDFASAGHPARAELHLREALWLWPDDAEAKKELGLLRAHGQEESLPEKMP